MAAGKAHLTPHGGGMELCVLHSHFRPGGVRSVIAAGLPALVRAAGVRQVTLAAGEAPDAAWRAETEAALHPCAVHWLVEPALGYWSEQQAGADEVRTAIRGTLARVIGQGVTVWAHNVSVGRNMILAQELAAAAARGAPLWLHHHDWWWDGRWERWPEMEAQGIHSLEEALAATLPCGEQVRHFSINAGAARQLSRWGGTAVSFLPNPAVPASVSRSEAGAAREFLRGLAGAEGVWIYPCRGLRRKNIAEALLVQRWLAPQAVTVTTGAASSAAEQDYFSTLTTTAAQRAWPLRMAVCTVPEAPAVAHLIAAADAVVVTSLREGFGLPFYEAAGRPLAARIPAGLAETMEATGFTFRHGWEELRVPRALFDAAGETRRVAAARAGLRRFLPVPLHRALHGFQEPVPGAAVDFGSLTLTAQLEVLSHAAEALGRSCAELNPQLCAPIPPQPPAAKLLTPAQWAETFLTLVRRPPLPAPAAQPAGPAIAALLPRWLRCPLLWPV